MSKISTVKTIKKSSRMKSSTKVILIVILISLIIGLSSSSGDLNAKDGWGI